jgi:hypothetical protein
MNPANLTPDELVQHTRPTTPLEIALHEALTDALEDLEQVREEFEAMQRSHAAIVARAGQNKQLAEARKEQHNEHPKF